MCMTIITYSVAKMNDINISTSSDKIHFLEKDMLENHQRKIYLRFHSITVKEIVINSWKINILSLSQQGFSA